MSYTLVRNFVAVVLVRVGAHAALNFKTAMDAVFSKAREKDYK